ncbi:MAG: hypothetical protein WCT17_02245 [Bacilli bacterium]
MFKRGKVYAVLSSVFKVFKKKPEIINLNEEIANQAIFVSNHSAASGPFTLSIYFPKLFRPWGIYHMCFGYRQRWTYLFYTFYQQKLGYKKFKSFILASLLGLVSGLAYRSMQVIPSYEDGRLVSTVKTSINHLKNDYSVLVFPEDSSKGYHEILTHYYPGFVLLAEQFNQKNQTDIPVYSVYYNKKENAFIIDKPCFLKRLLQEGHSREDIARIFRDRANELHTILHEKIEALRVSRKKGNVL